MREKRKGKKKARKKSVMKANYSILVKVFMNTMQMINVVVESIKIVRAS